jgi:hypothetical protein
MYRYRMALHSLHSPSIKLHRLLYNIKIPPQYKDNKREYTISLSIPGHLLPHHLFIQFITMHFNYIWIALIACLELVIAGT